MEYEIEFLDSLPSVRSYIRRRMIGEGESWTDVYGEAVTATIQFINDGRFREESSLKTIMRSIARNKVGDHFREKARQIIYLRQFTARPSLLERGKTDRYILPEYLSKMIERLPDNQRRVVCYYLYDHRTFDEIAEEFGIHKQTVKEWFKQAKKTLRCQLTRPVKRTIPEPKEHLAFVDRRTLEKLEWLTRFWNSYEGLCRANSEPMGSEDRIAEGRRVRNEIAAVLVCGDRGR